MNCRTAFILTLLVMFNSTLVKVSVRVVKMVRPQRVAEVGRLSTDTKNTFNSLARCVFANSRQEKHCFATNCQNCNKNPGHPGHPSHPGHSCHPLHPDHTGQPGHPDYIGYPVQ